MYGEDKSITTAQLLCMAFIGGMVIKMFMLPSLLAQVSGRDGAIVMLVYLVVEIINLVIVAYLIKKHPSITLFRMLRACFGEILSRVIVAVFILASTLKLILNLSEIKAFFSTSMFSSVRWEIMLIPLLLICVATSVKSLRVLGRTAELLLPVMIVGIALILLIVLREAPVKNALPLFENGLADTLKGITTFPMWFGDVTLLLVAMGRVKTHKKIVLYALAVRVSVAIIVLTFSVVLFATYGNVTSVIGYGHNVTSLTQYNLGSQEFGRFDLVVYSLWLLGVFLKIAMNFFFTVRCVAFFIGKSRYLYIAISLAVAAYVLSLIVFPTQSDVFTLSTGWAKYAFALMEYVTPVALLIVSSVRRARLKEVEGERAQA